MSVRHAVQCGSFVVALGFLSGFSPVVHADTATLADSAAPDTASGPAPALVAPAFAESPLAVTTRISPDPSHIADRLVLEVTVAYPAGYTVNLPTGTSFAPLHRVDSVALDPEPTGQGLRRVFRITLQHFALDHNVVPGFSLTYVDPNGQVKTHAVHPANFDVAALLANEANPERKGDDPPRSLIYPNERAEWIILGSLMALVAAALGAFAYLRWRQRSVPVLVVPERPAHEIALAALERLQARAHAMVEGDGQILYFLELTEILKGYLQRRFAVDSLDRTTDELRRELVRAAHRIEPLNANEVVGFLQECDLVKFARQSATPSAALAALAQVRHMVEASRPVAVVAGAHDAAVRPTAAAPEVRS